MLSITTRKVSIHIADGSAMSAYVARPEGDERAPVMFVYQEAFGVNAHIRSVADRFAQLGFAAIAPELFHRTGPGFEGSYTDFDAVRPHIGALTREGLEADIDATYAWAAEQNDFDEKRAACIGFCMGGRVSYLANARIDLCAAISFYGAGIAPDLLSVAKDQRAPILMFWGGLDAHIPPELYRSVADALREADKAQEQVIFGQANHGFFCDAREAYNEVAARQAWAMLQEFLRGYGAL